MGKYKPLVGHVVMIKNYSGSLHPRTMWVVKEVRPDLSLIVLPDRNLAGKIIEAHTRWVENDQLVKVPVIDGVAKPDLVFLP